MQLNNYTSIKASHISY